MTGPALASLSPELLDVQRRWFDLPRREQDDLYAREFAAPFARDFSKLPLHGAPRDMPRPRALVSVLGLSWQPVALMAAWCRPERMLILCTDESLKVTPAGDGVISFIARVAGVKSEVIEHVRVGDPGEADIYRAVRDFLRRAKVPPREIFVDPTGGKKSMSASAALAGFLAGTPLVYVDYGQYHGPNRIPIAGTEYPRLLANPLEVMGDLELRDVFGAFNRSDFNEAERLAGRLAARVYEPREAECLERLARGYAAWDRFDFRAAHLALQEARDVLDRFADQGGWVWASTVRDALARNLPALHDLEQVPRRPDRIEAGVPLLAWYLAAAGRFLAVGKPSLAVLLTYAAVERYVDLCLWIDFKLDDEKPDYSLVDCKLDREKHHEAGRRLFGKEYRPRELDGPIMFTNGAQLLAALAPGRLAMDDLGLLMGLSSARNSCEYEHGFLPKIPKCEDVERYLQRAKLLIGRVCSSAEDLDHRLLDHRFPTLDLEEASIPTFPTHGERAEH
ncbi:MAG: TIGR02710 family CRISPR-associated protein [Candidatus Schekmanbacteria bacterium]|nr:TIGR02710 family CRISPR-associated protein [Candidatus Schekmanbacteria bacterium]